jgi:hypothetical protein
MASAFAALLSQSPSAYVTIIENVCGKAPDVQLRQDGFRATVTVGAETYSGRGETRYAALVDLWQELKLAGVVA